MEHFFRLYLYSDPAMHGPFYGPFQTQQEAIGYAKRHGIELRYPVIAETWELDTSAPPMYVVEFNWHDEPWTLKEMMARDG